MAHDSTSGSVDPAMTPISESPMTRHQKLLQSRHINSLLASGQLRCAQVFRITKIVKQFCKCFCRFNKHCPTELNIIQNVHFSFLFH